MEELPVRTRELRMPTHAELTKINEDRRAKDKQAIVIPKNFKALDKAFLDQGVRAVDIGDKVVVNKPEYSKALAELGATPEEISRVVNRLENRYRFVNRIDDSTEEIPPIAEIDDEPSTPPVTPPAASKPLFEDQIPPPRKRNRPRLWILALALVLVALIVLGVYSLPHASMMVPTLTILAVILLAAALFWFSRLAIAIPILLALFLITAIVGWDYRKANTSSDVAVEEAKSEQSSPATKADVNAVDSDVKQQAAKIDDHMTALGNQVKSAGDTITQNLTTINEKVDRHVNPRPPKKKTQTLRRTTTPPYHFFPAPIPMGRKK